MLFLSILPSRHLRVQAQDIQKFAPAIRLPVDPLEDLVELPPVQVVVRASSQGEDGRRDLDAHAGVVRVAGRGEEPELDSSGVGAVVLPLHRCCRRRLEFREVDPQALLARAEDHAAQAGDVSGVAHARELVRLVGVFVDLCRQELMQRRREEGSGFGYVVGGAVVAVMPRVHRVNHDGLVMEVVVLVLVQLGQRAECRFHEPDDDDELLGHLQVQGTVDRAHVDVEIVAPIHSAKELVPESSAELLDLRRADVRGIAPEDRGGYLD